MCADMEVDEYFSSFCKYSCPFQVLGNIVKLAVEMRKSSFTRLYKTQRLTCRNNVSNDEDRNFVPYSICIYA